MPKTLFAFQEDIRSHSEWLRLTYFVRQRSRIASHVTLPHSLAHRLLFRGYNKYIYSIYGISRWKGIAAELESTYYFTSF